MTIGYQPMAKWPEKEETGDRRKSPFSATWSDTLQLLASELDKLSARTVTLRTMHLGSRCSPGREAARRLREPKASGA